MGKITCAALKRDVEAYADCESIFSLIQGKAAKSVSLEPNDIDFDFFDKKFCLMFSIGDECAVIDMDAVFSGLDELLCNDIAANATDFDFEYTEGFEEFDDWKIYIKGTESHNVQVETWAATQDEPGDVEVHGEELDFDEKKSLAWAKEQVKKILKYKPEAVYVGNHTFAAYPVVHMLRKKHIPVLTMVEKDGRNLLVRIPSGS